MLNAITIDVEDWFHVSRFSQIIDSKDWPKLESRVVKNVCRILKILKDFDVKATFFILAWVAENFPELVWTIHKNGHEIGSHGSSHKLIYNQTPDEFSEDLRNSLQILRDIVGPDVVVSYRAPSFSINLQTLWVFEILEANGVQIDSSFFPVKHDIYGGIMSPAEFFKIPVKSHGNVIECPLATITVAGKNFPIAGGGYLRMLPLWVIDKGIKSMNQNGQAAVIYFHPWELDPFQPRVAAGKINRFFHYNNLEYTEKKLRSILGKFPFSSLSHVVDSTNIKKTWPRW